MAYQMTYGGATYREDPDTISVEELIELYPNLKDLVDKYTEWEILKRSGPSDEDTLEDLK